jgi:hypothetical protein
MGWAIIAPRPPPSDPRGVSPRPPLFWRCESERRASNPALMTRVCDGDWEPYTRSRERLGGLGERLASVGVGLGEAEASVVLGASAEAVA